MMKLVVLIVIFTLWVLVNVVRNWDRDLAIYDFFGNLPDILFYPLQVLLVIVIEGIVPLIVCGLVYILAF